MSTSQASMKQNSDTTPPSSFAKHPLTPPPTDEKRFSQARRVLALFEAIQHGKHFSEGSWRKFQLVEGEYEEIERRLKKNHELFGYAKDKIRYDYNGESNRLVVRMPTAVHELFIARVEDAIFSQLKLIREGLGDAAAFARKVQPARSTEIYFPTEAIASTKQSKYEPDASFWHDDAQYPGVIIEVAYSQKRQRLNRLAENYLLDSDTSVRVVVGLDIEYGMRESRKATLSVWRSRIHHTADGDELRVVQEVCDEAFRDDQGNPSHHPGLRLRLSDFACEELSKEITGSEDQEITISTQQLCHYLAAAEDKIWRQGTLVRHSIPLSVKKRKRSETPPENIASDDEVKFIDLEERAAKRIADNDPDYEDT